MRLISLNDRKINELENIIKVNKEKILNFTFKDFGVTNLYQSMKEITEAAQILSIPINDIKKEYNKKIHFLLAHISGVLSEVNMKIKVDSFPVFLKIINNENKCVGRISIPDGYVKLFGIKANIRGITVILNNYKRTQELFFREINKKQDNISCKYIYLSELNRKSSFNKKNKKQKMNDAANTIVKYKDNITQLQNNFKEISNVLFLNKNDKKIEIFLKENNINAYKEYIEQKDLYDILKKNFINIEVDK